MKIYRPTKGGMWVEVGACMKVILNGQLLEIIVPLSDWNTKRRRITGWSFHGYREIINLDGQP